MDWKPIIKAFGVDTMEDLLKAEDLLRSQNPDPKRQIYLKLSFIQRKH